MPFLAIPFPALDPVAIAIGPFAIRWYALAYIVGLLIGWRYCLMLAERPPHRVGRSDIDDFLVWATLGVVLGGRIGYVLFYQAGYYSDHPLEALYLWHGGMSFHGGALGVTTAIVLFTWARRLPIFAFSDIICAAIPIGLFFGRIANFINGELYGRPTTVPWGMQFPAELLDHPNEATLAIQETIKIDPTLNNVPDIITAARHSAQVREVLASILTPRHPSQLYEAFLEGILLFTLLILIRLKFKKPDGMTTGCFFILYPVMRITGELFREPDAPLTGPFTRGQFLSLFMFLVGALFLWNAWRKKTANRSI